MPPHPCGPVYVVLLCHYTDNAVLVPFVFPSLLGDTSHKLWVSGPILSTQCSSLLYLIVFAAATAVTDNQELSCQS
jgi:hypothetical protein